MRILRNDPELPPEVEDVEVTRRNNTLILKAVAADDISVSTPRRHNSKRVSRRTACTRRTPTRWGRPGPRAPKRRRWTPVRRTEEEEEEIETELVEYACFKGDRETVLQNTALQYRCSRPLMRESR